MSYNENELDERAFLNRKGDGGLAAIRIYHDRSDSYVSAWIEISDCSRTVTLDFGYQRKDGRESEVYDNALAKAKKLASFANRMVREIEAYPPIEQKK